MREWEDAELIDDPNVLKVYADDVGKLEFVGSVARITYVEHRRTQSGLWIRYPVLEMMRPAETVGLATLRRLMRNMDRAAHAAVGLVEALH